MSEPIDLMSPDIPSTQPLPLEEGQILPQRVPGWVSFVSGGFGGTCLVLVGHPFDLVKVRLQAGIQKYSSMGDGFKNIIAKDGISGLYRGMLAPLIGVTPIFAVSFWGYAVGQKLVTINSSAKEKELSLTQISIAGAFSAFPTTILMTPFERIKVMAQIQESNSYKGPLSLLSSMVKKKGIVGATKTLYKGTVATILRDAPGSMAYFATYEILKKEISKFYTSNGDKKPTLPVAAILISGGLAGMANWIVAIPADVIKSRIQAGAEGSGIDVLKKLIRTEGPRSLFKGLGPALVRAFPANAACFAGVEISTEAIKKFSSPLTIE